MQHKSNIKGGNGTTHGKILYSCLALFTISLIGCGSTSSPPTQVVAQHEPQTYFAPFVEGTTSGGVSLNFPQTFKVDDSCITVGNSCEGFVQTGYGITLLQVSDVLSTGVLQNNLPRGLLGLGMTSSYAVFTRNWTTYNQPLPLGFALELPGQAGGIVQLPGQPAAPLTATVACPNITTAQSYLYLTIPIGFPTPVSQQFGGATWDPTAETAYGVVDISSNGEAINFNNGKQFSFPFPGGGSGPVSNPSPSSVAATCGPTTYGNTISLPGQVVVTDPTGGQSFSFVQAVAGIGSRGLLVESNGSTSEGGYQNTLGAGTGAVGLPKPGTPVDNTTLLSAQYLGFVYGAGLFNRNSTEPPAGWSSHLTSFGFPANLQSSCSSFALETGPLVNGVYGGDFPQNSGQDNPAASSTGYGNCDLAIDLGTQDPITNGLYPNAKVWMGGAYAANTSQATYSFPAVAIAGQLQGQNAIFILGVDSTQPWEIYLLQSK